MLESESLTGALIECVKAAGGSKVVGHKLWPEKTVDAAQRHLANCLSDTRSERLSPDQVLLVARLARERGCHAYMHFLAVQLGYAEPVPVAPRDESDELRRQLLESTRNMQAMMQRLEALEAQRAAGAANGLVRVA